MPTTPALGHQEGGGQGIPVLDPEITFRSSRPAGHWRVGASERKPALTRLQSVTASPGPGKMAVLFSSLGALVSPAGGRPRSLCFLAEVTVFQMKLQSSWYSSWIWNFP